MWLNKSFLHLLKQFFAGSRFALMQSKLLLYHVLANFAFEVSDKTGIPMRYVKDFKLEPERPIIALRKR